MSVSERGEDDGVGLGILTTEQGPMRPADAFSRPEPLAPKIVNEVRELHERCASLDRDGTGMRGRRARRERREAREAETDLLRVLGFANYSEFVAVVAAGDDAERSALGLALVEPSYDVDAAATAADDADAPPVPDADVALEARRTEAALLRVLNSERRGPAPDPRTDAPRGAADAVTDAASGPALADVHSRIAVFEEELAEARFELRRMKDELRGRRESPEPAVPATTAPDTTGMAVHDAAAALVRAASELQSLGEMLRTERAELVELVAVSRAQAEQLFEQARADAQRIRDDAAAEADALLEKARADAVALTRNALSTIDGLRLLAAEAREPGDAES